jgi:hypothetical protein
MQARRLLGNWGFGYVLLEAELLGELKKILLELGA